MDSGVDFIKPEFLNILFFQQKTLVIFPYVDLKHLHALELFAEGYNVVNLESTALVNLKEILEYDTNNNYSQKPTLYFVYNADKDRVQEIIQLEGIHCIINTNENVSDLANGTEFIFYNKKNNQFLNYNISNSELVFENELITTSENEVILQDKIQKLKTAAAKIYTEINQNSNLDKLPQILVEYERKYWNKILDYTRNYYQIEIPKVKSLKFISKSRIKKDFKDFSHEYEMVISQNKIIAKEFIQMLHDYRSKKVNPANLELEELYNPQKLYTYLRNHHWKDGIPDDYLAEWIKMNHSQYELTDSDKLDFQIIFDKLGILYDGTTLLSSLENSNSFSCKNEIILESMPSIKENYTEFKGWILEIIDLLEQNNRMDIDSALKSVALEEILAIIKKIRESVKN